MSGPKAGDSPLRSHEKGNGGFDGTTQRQHPSGRAALAPRKITRKVLNSR
jgi:hypothetical protein